MRRTSAIWISGSLCLLLGAAGAAYGAESPDESGDSAVAQSDGAVAQAGAEAQPDAVAQADAGAQAGAEAQRPKRKVKSGVEEIVVRARRREETIQETPVSVTAFSPEDLIDRNITNLQDIGQYVPNLQFDESIGEQNDARIYLRGVGNGDSIITDEAGVGIVVDDVFLPRAAGVLQALADVRNIEVLSGPQATLYGKNTVGGVVRITSNKPGWTQEGSARVRIGSNMQLRPQLIWNQPLISERLSLRLNLGGQYDRGPVDNRGAGRDRTGQTRSIDGVVQLLYTPSEDVEFLFKGRRGYSNSSGLEAKCKLRGGITDGPDDGLDGRLFGPQGTIGSYDEACRASQEADFDEVSFDGRQESDLDSYSTSLVATWSLTPSLTFKSVSAWGRNVTARASDDDSTSLPLSNESAFNKTDSTQDALSQEFNLAGEMLDGRLNWVTGVYVLKEKNQDDSRNVQNSELVGRDPETFAFAGFNNDIMAAGPVSTLAINGRTLDDGRPLLRLTNGVGPCIETFASITIIPRLVSTTPCTRQVFPFRSISARKSDVLSYAGYGQVDFDLTDQWSFSLGTRYTHERKDVDRIVDIFSEDLPLVQEIATASRGNRLNIFARSKRFGRFSPSASISFKPTDDWNLYASWGRGFKSGGFNGRGVGDANEILDYDEEVVTNYELGIKGELFDLARITMAYFHTKYSGIQLIQARLDADTRRFLVETDNFGDAVINGFEFTVAMSPIDRLFINANMGITSGRYTKINQVGGTVTPVDSNNRLTGTPTYTGSVSASYLIPAGVLGDIRANLNWSHQGRKANDTANLSFSGKRGTLGASLSFELPDGKTRITLGGSNLLEREYLSNSFVTARNDFEYFGRGRELYLEASTDF
jgi:iron complex outermembrane recepter protein